MYGHKFKDGKEWREPQRAVRWAPVRYTFPRPPVLWSRKPSEVTGPQRLEAETAAEAERVLSSSVCSSFLWDDDGWGFRHVGYVDIYAWGVCEASSLPLLLPN